MTFAEAAALVLAARRTARAHIVTLNPGVKLAYSFGPDGGWTYGFEIAVAWMTPEIDWRIGSGTVLDFTWTKGGIFVDPYYTASFAIGRPYRGEIGTYLKLPICLHDDEGCYEGGSGGSGWDSDLDWD